MSRNGSARRERTNPYRASGKSLRRKGNLPHNATRVQRFREIDIARVAQASLFRSEVIVTRLLPGGRRRGDEYIVCNPTRSDSHPGSFKINLRTGRWGDFATDKRGGDLVALLAYLDGISHPEAARTLSRFLGMEGSDHG